MRRYLLSPSAIKTEDVLIEGDAFHHIFDVCRQEKGSKFEVLGNPGIAYFVEVFEVGKKSARAKILNSRVIPALPKPHLVLAISIPRFPVMDAVVEKAVEMGVSEIRPFFSDFSFVRSSSTLPSSKLDRWKKIVVSATQQSGRGDLMPIQDPLSFEKTLQEFNQSPLKAGLFAYEGASPKAIKDFISEMPKDLEKVWIFVGSEGGFSNAEVQRIQDLGLAPVTLGDQVLRVETACIALVSILKYEAGLMASQLGG